MLPDMSEVLDEFAQAIVLNRIVQTIVNHRPVNTPTPVNIEAVVQPAQKEKLNPDKIDWSLKYLLVHSKQEVIENDQMVHKSKNYKAMEDGDYSDYGFYETIFEEIK